MVTSIHTLIYSEDADATRAFFRDVLALPYVDYQDSGWLIFKSGPSELGVHPAAGEWEGKPFSHPIKHEISLMCDDINVTVADLKSKGAQFKGEIADHGYGLVIMLEVPGAGLMQLYQPLHPKAYDL